MEEIPDNVPYDEELALLEQKLHDEGYTLFYTKELMTVNGDDQFFTDCLNEAYMLMHKKTMDLDLTKANPEQILITYASFNTLAVIMGILKRLPQYYNSDLTTFISNFTMVLNWLIRDEEKPTIDTSVKPIEHKESFELNGYTFIPCLLSSIHPGSIAHIDAYNSDGSLTSVFIDSSNLNIFIENFLNFVQETSRQITAVMVGSIPKGKTIIDLLDAMNDWTARTMCKLNDF